MTIAQANGQLSTQLTVGPVAIQVPTYSPGTTIINLGSNPVNLSDLPTADYKNLNPLAQTVLPGNGSLVWTTSTCYAISPKGSTISVHSGTNPYFNPNPTMPTPALDEADYLAGISSFSSFGATPPFTGSVTIPFQANQDNYAGLAVYVSLVPHLPVTINPQIIQVTFQINQNNATPFNDAPATIVNNFGIVEMALFKLPVINSQATCSITVMTNVNSPITIGVYGCRSMPDLRVDGRQRPKGDNVAFTTTTGVLIPAPTGLQRIMLQSVSLNGYAAAAMTAGITATNNGGTVTLCGLRTGASNINDSDQMVINEGFVLDPATNVQWTGSGSGFTVMARAIYDIVV